MWRGLALELFVVFFHSVHQILRELKNEKKKGNKKAFIKKKRKEIYTTSLWAVWIVIVRLAHELCQH